MAESTTMPTVPEQADLPTSSVVALSTTTTCAAAG
jgi:hypothetical protein